MPNVIAPQDIEQVQDRGELVYDEVSSRAYIRIIYPNICRNTMYFDTFLQVQDEPDDCITEQTKEQDVDTVVDSDIVS